MKQSIVDIFQKFFASRMNDVHTMIPGTIETYSGHTTRKASVKPMVKMKLLDNSDLEIEPIDNVPVMFPSSAGFSLLYPIKRGDGCMILFSEIGIGNYINGGGDVKEADDMSRFSLTDAVCIPGLFPFTQSPSTLNTIELTESGELKLLNGTFSFVKGETLETLLNSFWQGAWASMPAGTQVQNAAILTALQAQAAASAAQTAMIKSVSIKGK